MIHTVVSAGNGNRETLRFAQSWRRWPRIPWLLFVIVVLYFIFLKADVDPFRSFGFLFMLAIVLLDIIVGLFLSLRAPQGFQINDSLLIVVWKKGEERVSFDSLRIWKVPRLLYRGVVILRSGSRWFVVYDGLHAFTQFMDTIEDKVRR